MADLYYWDFESHAVAAGLPSGWSNLGSGSPSFEVLDSMGHRVLRVPSTEALSVILVPDSSPTDPTEGQVLLKWKRSANASVTRNKNPAPGMLISDSGAEYYGSYLETKAPIYDWKEASYIWRSIEDGAGQNQAYFKPGVDYSLYHSADQWFYTRIAWRGATPGPARARISHWAEGEAEPAWEVSENLNGAQFSKIQNARPGAFGILFLPTLTAGVDFDIAFVSASTDADVAAPSSPLGYEMTPSAVAALGTVPAPASVGFSVAPSPVAALGTVPGTKAEFVLHMDPVAAIGDVFEPELDRWTLKFADENWDKSPPGKWRCPEA